MVNLLPIGLVTIPLDGISHSEEIPMLYSREFVNSTRYIENLRSCNIPQIHLEGNDYYIIRKVLVWGDNNDPYPIFGRCWDNTKLLGGIERCVDSRMHAYASHLRVQSNRGTTFPFTENTTVQYDPTNHSLKLDNTIYEGPLEKDVLRVKEVNNNLKELFRISVETVKLHDLINPLAVPRYRGYAEPLHIQNEKLLAILDVRVDCPNTVTIEEARLLLNSSYMVKGTFQPTAAYRKFLQFRYGGYTLPNNWEDWFI